tara:strand:+ start:388 stop:681 length:294 start_codon:yes stop_codon:yes gene_type:complete
MTRYKMSNNEKVQMSSAEEAEVDTFQQAHIDDAPNRRMADLRQRRDALLVETDYMGNSDVVMSEDWVTYRQALRDITSQTPSDDALSNITFPTKPTE